MSRWFRHYAGMMRDEKLVSAAVKSKQPVERVVWVWGAILESAAAENGGGAHNLDCSEAAYFLRCGSEDIAGILVALVSEKMLTGRNVVGWRARFKNSPRVKWQDWQFTRLAVFERDKFTCRYCSAHGVALECDHVIPLSRGGTDDQSNLVTACKSCNNRKGAKTLEELGWELEQ